MYMFQAAIEICLSRLSGLTVESDPRSAKDDLNNHCMQNNDRNTKNEMRSNNANNVAFKNENNYSDKSVNSYANFVLSGNNSNQNKSSYDNHRVNYEYNATQNKAHTNNSRASNADSITNFSDISTKPQMNFQRRQGDLITEQEINRLIQDRCDLRVQQYVQFMFCDIFDV